MRDIATGFFFPGYPCQEIRLEWVTGIRWPLRLFVRSEKHFMLTEIIALIIIYIYIISPLKNGRIICYNGKNILFSGTAFYIIGE